MGMRERFTSAKANIAISFQQEQFLQLWQRDTKSTAYNSSVAMHMRGATIMPALQSAYAALIKRQMILRCQFVPPVGTAPAQQRLLEEADVASCFGVDGVAGGSSCLLAKPDGLLEVVPGSPLHDKWTAIQNAPFDLFQGPLTRLRVLRLASDEHILLLVQHHSITDGISLSIMLGELVLAYNAVLAGTTPQWDPLPLQYVDYAAWQRNYLSGAMMEAQMDWWKRELAGAPPLLTLPTDRPRPDTASYKGGEVPLAISAGTAAGLRHLAASERTTIFVVLLAAFKVLLARMSGQDDVVVGTPHANRDRPELANVLGVFVNTVALRTDLGGDPTFSILVDRVKRSSMAAFAHSEAPFAKVVEALKVRRSAAYTPIYQALLVLDPDVGGGGGAGMTGLVLSSVGFHSGNGGAATDVVVNLSTKNDRLEGVLTYAKDLFDESTMERMAGHFAQLLASIVAAPSTPISSLQLMAQEERDLVLTGFNQTEATFNSGVCIHQLFEAAAAKVPDATCIVHNYQRLTYGEVDRRANMLAHWLLANGVQPDTAVAVCMDKRPELYIALLAILKAGGAYLHVDPALPQERAIFVLQQAGARILLTQGGAEAVQGLPGMITLLLDDGWSILEGRPSTSPGKTCEPSNLCYYLFTSGSTGQPKGVMVAHAGVVNLLTYARTSMVPSLVPGQMFVQNVSISFDPSVMDIWLPFSSGCGIVIPPPDAAKDPDTMRALIERHRIVFFATVPSQLQALLDTCKDPSQLGSLRTTITGGEVLNPKLIALAHKKAPQLVVRNVYGPTESTVLVTDYPCQNPKVASRSFVPIGKPIANTRMYICDPSSLEPVPIGIEGELYVSGICLAKGYAGRADLTADRFVPNPFVRPGDDPSYARMYKTGDLAAWMPDGNIKFIGRADGQIKLRGFRVELGEVEAIVASAAGVREVVAVLQDANTDAAALVVNVSKEQGADVNVEALLATARAHLPHYMVPSSVRVLSRMPLLPNGKLNRKALPHHDIDLSTVAEYVAPTSRIETVIQAAWEDTLALEPNTIGVHANFFEVGGNSLRAGVAVSKIREMLKAPEIPGAWIYECQTVASFAAKLAASGMVPTEENAEEIIPPPVLPPPRAPGFLISAAQAVAVIAATGFACWWLLAMSLSVFRLYEWHPESRGAPVFLVGLPVVMGTLLVILLLLSIVAKWVLMFRYREGRHPLWGWQYLRWWTVRLLTRTSLTLTMSFITETEILNSVYRLLGAKIGKRCRISTLSITEWDLVEIGDDCVIGPGVRLSPAELSTAEGGVLTLRKICVGRGCVVGGAASLAPGTVLQPGSVVQPLAAVPAHGDDVVTVLPRPNVKRNTFGRPVSRALPTLQALVSVFVAVYSQLLILGGTLMFISFLFGLIFSHTTAAAAPDAERLAIQIYLHTCLLNGSLTSERLALCRVIDISLIKTICLSVIIFVAIIAFVPRTVTLIAKWVLLGRVPSDPGVARRRFFWRLRCHMFAHIEASPLNGIAGTLWDGTAVVSWYYRAMGAQIGRDTWLPSDLGVENYDALVIGDGVTIGGSCSIASAAPPAGMEALFEENMVYASLVDGFEPHAIIIEDGVHLGHGVFVSEGTRIRRGAILGDYTVALPDRHFPPHSVTQGTVRLQEGDVESDIEAPLPPPPTEAASRRIASIALMRRAAADSAAQRALYGSRRSSAGVHQLSLMPGSARSSHNSSIANLEGSGRDRRAYQNAVSAVMPSGPRMPQTPFEIIAGRGAAESDESTPRAFAHTQPSRAPNGLQGALPPTALEASGRLLSGGRRGSGQLPPRGSALLRGGSTGYATRSGSGGGFVRLGSSNLGEDAVQSSGPHSRRSFFDAQRHGSVHEHDPATRSRLALGSTFDDPSAVIGQHTGVPSRLGVPRRVSISSNAYTRQSQYSDAISPRAETPHSTFTSRRASGLDGPLGHLERAVGSQMQAHLDSRRSSMALIGPDGSRAASMSQARPIAGGLVDQDLGDMGSSWWQNWGHSIVLVAARCIFIPLTIIMTMFPFLLGVICVMVIAGPWIAAAAFCLTVPAAMLLSTLYLAVVCRMISHWLKDSVPFYSARFMVWELATTIGQLADNGLLSLVDGSVFALWKMRVLGTRVGRGACIFGGSRVETMALTIHEGAIIGEGALLQGHTVERLAATFLPTEIGKQVCLQPWCNLLPGSAAQDGSIVTELSVVMKGEVVSERTIWTGCPARPLGWKAAAAFRAAADGDPSPGTAGTGTDKNKSMKDEEGDLEAALLQSSAIELANTSSLPHGLV